MAVASQLRNRIPELLKGKGWTISDLQRKTGLSYPATHNIANDSAIIISDETRVGTLRLVCEALGVKMSDVVDVEIVPEE